jgi:hypothetical protein
MHAIVRTSSREGTKELFGVANCKADVESWLT